MYAFDRLFIDGEWAKPDGNAVLEVESPARQATIGRVPLGSAGDMERAVAAARRAFDEGPWPQMAPAERAAALGRLCDALQERSEAIATAVSEEVGTPISLSRLVQAGAPVMFMRYYADHVASFGFEEVRQGLMGASLVRREPVGVAALVVPWNYPLYLTASKLAPALLAGCTVVLKPSSESPINAFLLAQAVEEAGLPAGVFNLLPTTRDVGEQLVAHRGVDKVSFTGSTDVGRRMMALCSQRIARVTLELGGKSACIVLDDAALDVAVPMMANAAFINSGQTCVAQTRLLVSRRRHDEVVDRLCEVVGAMAVGDPMDPVTTMGPLVSARQRARVEEYIRVGQDEGAKIVIGGGRPAEPPTGYYVAPTIFDGVDNSMRIAQEEIFGPVLSVITYDDEDDAVAIANDSPYGLSGAVWAGDPERGLDVAKRVRTGTFHVNGLGMDPGSPFGGYKQSGLGRELGPEGLAPYLEVKTVSLPAGFSPTVA
ncbi:MAG: aldehyde dehydrogenase [Actinomycetota bacterium]|nr:aldehyde dehydrogenase [Actinomycetota bacterium]